MYARRNKEPPVRVGSQGDEASSVHVVRMGVVHELSEEQLEGLYMWVDEVPLSRPKRNITRDFSDGVLMAEILKCKVKQGVVDLHNYPACNNVKGKQSNWMLLNRKVLCRMNTEISSDVVDAICQCRPHVIESVLCVLRDKIDMYLAGQMNRPARRRDVSSDMRPEADQVDFGSRGYVPSAEGFYQDGQYQSPTTRSHNAGKQELVRMYPEYAPVDMSYKSNPGKQHQAPLTMPSGNIGNAELLPKSLLDEREIAIENRGETIMMLQAKIQRLEQLLTLKDMRIDDLAGKLDQLQISSSQQGPQRGGMSSNRLVNKTRPNQPNKRHQQVASGRY